MTDHPSVCVCLRFLAPGFLCYRALKQRDMIKSYLRFATIQAFKEDKQPPCFLENKAQKKTFVHWAR